MSYSRFIAKALIAVSLLSVGTAANANRALMEAISASNNALLVTTGTVPATIMKGSPWNDVRAFGAVCNGSTDDSTAIQAAINFSSPTAARVFIPALNCSYATGLTVPQGVVIEGVSRSTYVLSIPITGSVLKYTGSGTAISLNGSNTVLRNLVVYNPSGNATNGVLVNGNTNSVEGPIMDNVIIYGFTGGTALNLVASNGGDVVYGVFNNVRIRSAATGLDMNAPSGGAAGFINNNTFINLVISGNNVFQYGIRYRAGNANQFINSDVEPPQSVFGHLSISTGAIQYYGRIEADNQVSTVPVINISSSVVDGGGWIDGVFGGGLVINGAPDYIDFRMYSGKNPGVRRSSRNIFPNTIFQGVNTTAHTIPEWDVTETGGASTWAIVGSSVATGHNVIQITVAAGAKTTITPTTSPAYNPIPLNGQTQCNFGLWVNVSSASLQGGVAYATLNGPSGLTSSADHPGNGLWQAIGMAQNFNPAQNPIPKFVLDNTAGGASVVFQITAPFFAFDFQPVDTVKVFSTAGGEIDGNTTFNQSLGVGSIAGVGAGITFTTNVVVQSSFTQQNTAFSLGGGSLTGNGGMWSSPSQACVTVVLNYGQIVPSTLASFTDVYWSGVLSNDPESMYGGASSSNTITIPNGGAGTYDVNCQIQWANNTSGRRIVDVRKNSTSINGGETSTGALSGALDTVYAITVQVEAVAGDVFKCRVLQNSGGNLATSADSTTSHMSVCKRR